MTSIEVTWVKDSKLILRLWTEKKKKLLNICCRKTHYKVETSENFDETVEVELTVKERESIVSNNCGRIKESEG